MRIDADVGRDETHASFDLIVCDRRVEAGDGSIVGGDRALHVARRVLAARAHALERDLVDIGGVARRIDLDVSAAGRDELADDLARDGDHIGEKGVHVRVDRLGTLPGEALGDAGGVGSCGHFIRCNILPELAESSNRFDPPTPIAEVLSNSGS